MGEIRWPETPADRIRLLVERVLHQLGVEGDVVIREDEERIEAEIVGDGDYRLLIGRRGQTIDALQLLCFQAAFKGLDDRKQVIIDAAGYHRRRNVTLIARADRAAERALRGNAMVAMDPMSAQERRIVHDHLRKRLNIETFSEGDERCRFVVVVPVVDE